MIAIIHIALYYHRLSHLFPNQAEKHFPSIAFSMFCNPEPIILA